MPKINPNIRDKVFLFASLATIALSAISYYLFQAPWDPCRCKTLIEDGFWLDWKHLKNWQPAGCMLHTYKDSEAKSCFNDSRAVFIGGTNTQRLFEGVAKKFDEKYVLPAASHDANVLTTVGGVRFEFTWDPYLESKELRELQDGSGSTTSRPSLAVIGIGQEYMRRDDDTAVFSANVGSLMSALRGTADDEHRHSNAVVIAPLMETNLRDMFPAEIGSITRAKIDTMNGILSKLSAEHQVDVAFAFNEISKGRKALDRGMYPNPGATAAMADVLLNLRCNVYRPHHYPYSSTCCNGYPGVSWVQLAGFVFVVALIPVGLFLHNRGYTPTTSTLLRLLPAQDYFKPILVMGFAVVLCWYCDRTNIFGKEQKQTSPPQFFYPMIIIIIVSSILTRRTNEKDLAFLNREQTDEWKGWMQVAILVYHYVGVSKTEYIYNYMRACPTSYLFMTGFGHTCYFLKKGDYSFKRFVATMLRLNLLNVILAYAMGNDWLLYYFAPLVTWNFFVIFGLLWFKHDWNKNTTFLFTKMIIAALANAAFCSYPGALEYTWSILQTLFRMEGDLREWRFRVTLDQYSVFPGMVFGVFFVNWSSYSLPKSTWWPAISRFGILVSCAIMLGYAWFEVNQESKYVYNRKHPYVSWLPCCAFVIIRNATPWLRRTHNEFFAWIGRCSLETFLLQFHIWLAADTAGLLVLGPTHSRVINAVITTPIFLFIAAAVTSATGSVIEWIMTGQPKPARPTLPTSQNTHPANLPTQATVNAGPQMKDGPLLSKEANGDVSSAVPMNGQPVEIKTQDPSKLEKGGIQSQTSEIRSGRLSVAWKDLRVRVGFILGMMVFMNWTYYL